MKKNSLFLVFLIAIYSTISAQTNSFTVNPEIVMLEDSLENKSLLSSLDAFLSLAQDNSPNKWILPTEIIETQILIDEIAGIQKNNDNQNDSFFKPYLTNIIPIGEDKYAVKISYIGITENSASLRANFEVIAHRSKDLFLFSSPLLRNTQNWKTKKIQNHTFYYPYTIADEKVQKLADQSVFFDEKLNNNSGETYYYLCKEETNPLKLFGVEYKSDYNGDDLRSSWSSRQDNETLEVLNESLIYGISMHDLWHHRFSQVMSRKKVHKRVDCHIATLYGGLWGIGWEELFPLFKEKFVVGQNVDWLAHKKNSSHFITNEKRKNYTDDFVGALLIKKIEREKGFDGIWELLKTKRTKEEKEYFSILEKLTGITKENYNKEVSKLIEAEIARLDS